MNTRAIDAPAPGRPLTGRGFLLMLLALFGCVAAVNFYMVYYALSTFPGEEVDHPYEVGVNYNQQLEAARAQDKLGWKVSASVSPVANGEARIVVDARDSANQAITGLQVAVSLESPVDRARDHKAALAADGDGAYSASAPATPGRWDLVIVARDSSGALKFLSRNRVDIR